MTTPLVQKWRETANIELTFDSVEHKERAYALRKCADELEAEALAGSEEGQHWRDPKGEQAFKNFHRSLCARFGCTHDEEYWWRDQVSLEEHIAKLTTPPRASDVEVDDAMVQRAQWAYDEYTGQTQPGNLQMRAALNAALNGAGARGYGARMANP